MNVLIVGGGLQGLSCAESLKKKHRVSAVGHETLTRQSRLYDKVYDSEYGKGEKLIQLLKEHQYDVLIPTSDLYVSEISKSKNEIERRTGTKCAVPSYDFVYIVEDKSRFMNFCEENNIPHPKTVKIDEDSIDYASSVVGFPSLIKPDYSVGARGITRVNNVTELRTKLSEVTANYGTCTLQEFIDNKEFYYNVMLYRDKNGKFLAHTIIKIVRMYPIDAGSSSCCISIEDDKLLNVCKECLDKLNWVGMADFDVLQRLDNKEFKIIEINPRVPASLRAAQISGVNFPEILVNDSMNIPIPKYEYNPGKIMRYLGIDIMWFLKSDKRFISMPSWFSFAGKDIYYQDILLCDSASWWTWFATGFQKILKLNKKLR